MKCVQGRTLGEIEDFAPPFTVVFSYRAWGGASKNGLRGKNWKNQIVANVYKTYLRL